MKQLKFLIFSLGSLKHYRLRDSFDSNALPSMHVYIVNEKLIRLLCKTHVSGVKKLESPALRQSDAVFWGNG